MVVDVDGGRERGGEGARGFPTCSREQSLFRDTDLQERKESLSPLLRIIDSHSPPTPEMSRGLASGKAGKGYLRFSRDELRRTRG
jgi:hypothetical protein